MILISQPNQLKIVKSNLAEIASWAHIKMHSYSQRIDTYFGIVTSRLTILLYSYCISVLEKVRKGQC